MPRSVMLALLVPAYVLAGRIGLLLAFANENASPVWAPPATTDLGAQTLPLTLMLTPWSMNVVTIK